MTVDPLIYLPGTEPSPGPLARFLPPVPEGAAAEFIARHALTPGSWLLDPFGASPALAVELARTGCRVLVAVNNPVTRFLLEMTARPPARSELQAALSDLSSARKGDERIESHLQALYTTQCTRCQQSVPVEAFIWERGGEAPVGRIYTCTCGESGEHPATEADKANSRRIAATASLHRARALERVVALTDPDRPNVEEALECYLPRAVYALITIANKLDGLRVSVERRRLLDALLLFACDEANTLWAHPADRPRPRQLTVPSRFLEKNVWRALERGVEQWSGAVDQQEQVPLTTWPEPPPETGGICLYEGPVRSLAPHLEETPPAALIAAVPRPNQAFWTLSALWAGWIWGREAVTPFKGVLHRRRYDWSWHASALYAALKNLVAHIPLKAPFFALVTEPEASYLTAVLLAASGAGFDLSGLALRSRQDPVQALWNRRSLTLPVQNSEIDPEAVQEAMQSALLSRGEPLPYLHLHAAGLQALAEEHALAWQKDALASLNAPIQAALASGAFVHFGGGEGLDTGLWGLAKTPKKADEALSLPDRVEMFLVPYLQKHPACPFPDLEAALNSELRGLLTPSLGLVKDVLGSYAVEADGLFSLRPEDAPSARRADLEEAEAHLITLGGRLGFKPERPQKDERLLLWKTKTTVAYAFHLLVSAVAGGVIRASPYPPAHSLLVLPGGRAGLLLAKLRRDPALQSVWDKGWRVLKFRQLRSLADASDLDRTQWERELSGDPLEPPEQIRMF